MSKKFYILVFVVLGAFAIVTTVFFSDTRNYLISTISAITDGCKTAPTVTFMKSYRVKDTADTYGIAQTSDGGYAITGRTINHAAMEDYSMFLLKADSNGNKIWSKLINSFSPTSWTGLGSAEGYAVTQLSNGNYVAAGETVGYRTAEDQENLEGQGDGFVMAFDGTGNNIWARTVSRESIDVAYKLEPTLAGGFSMSGSTGILVGRPDVADIGHTLFLGNFDINGNTNWLKKIESSENMTKSVSQTSDGGYILIGDIKLVKENDQHVPALVKLKKDGTYEWATGLENLPIEIPNLIIAPDGKSFEIGTPNKIHLTFGDFISANQTSDGGYIAFGKYVSAISDAALLNIGDSILKESSIVAVKVDSTGKLKWARVVKIKKYLEDTVVEKTKDGGYVIMGNNLVGGYFNTDNVKQYQDMLTAYYEKYPIMSPETPESKKAMEEISAEIEAWQTPLMKRNILLVKTDANFKFQWGKTIGGTKDLDGYAITSTSDSGYAIAGTWHTGIKYKKLTSTMEYTEAMILKLDSNGNLSNNTGLITDFKDVEKSDVTSYIVTNKLNSPSLILGYAMENLARTIKSVDKVGVTTVTSEAKVYDATSCNTTSKDDSTGTITTTKTRAEMKYDETIEIEATTTKGKIVDDELTPILNKIFNNEVKLWDDDSAGWVAYRFKRLVTRDDISKISDSMTDLGYKIDSNQNGDFTATKVGMTLNLHFYLGDTNAGQLDVMY